MMRWLLVVLMLIPQLAFADWTVPPDLGTTVGAQKGILVAHAGERAAGVHPSVTAVTKSLGATGTLVMDDASLGDIRKLGDPDIVKKAAHLPIDRVVIVRVFDQTAVLTVYELSGTAVAGLTINSSGTSAASTTPEVASEPEEPEEPEVELVQQPRDEGRAASDGTSEEAWKSVGEVYEENERDAIDVNAAFENLRVRVVTITTVNQYGGVVGTGATFFKGSRQVRGRDIWTAIERPDLAEKYDKRKTTKIGLIVASGAALVIGGLMTIPVATSAACNDVDFVNRTPCRSAGLAYAGAVVAFFGLLGVSIIPFTYSPHPVTLSEAIFLYETYNERLAAKLKRHTSLVPKVDLTPVRGGMGTTLRWEF